MIAEIQDLFGFFFVIISFFCIQASYMNSANAFEHFPHWMVIIRAYYHFKTKFFSLIKKKKKKKTIPTKSLNYQSF